jgi:hypothetical protein
LNTGIPVPACVAAIEPRWLGPGSTIRSGPAGHVNPPLHGLRSVGGARVEGDVSAWSQVVNEIEDALEEQQTLSGFTQARPDDDAVVWPGFECFRYKLLRGLALIDEASIDIITERAHAFDLLVNI